MQSISCFFSPAFRLSERIRNRKTKRVKCSYIYISDNFSFKFFVRNLIFIRQLTHGALLNMSKYQLVSKLGKASFFMCFFFQFMKSLFLLRVYSVFTDLTFRIL